MWSLVCVCVCVLAASVSAKSCGSGANEYGNANIIPFVDGSTMELVATTTNGKLYQLTVNSGPDSMTFPIVHVYGTPYEQGFAHGQLLSESMNIFFNSAWNYLVDAVAQDIPLPKYFADKLANEGLDAALDYEYEITVNYTSPDFYEEMQGLSDGSGVDYLLIRRMHMLPGLTKGSCSMFGTWDLAVPQPQNHLIQLRALDWDMDGPYRDYPAIVVYHPDPSDTGAHPWVNVGFAGWIGGLTGVSSMQMGISEIGVTYPDDSFGPPIGTAPLPGTPFIVLLRDILKYDNTLDEALSRMQNAHRSENLVLGVGDAKAGYFSGVQYGPYVFNVMTPETQAPVADWHPSYNDTLYWGMDWVCPTFNSELGALLEENYGQITAELTVRNILGQLQSGTNHIGVYDLTAQQFYVSFAGHTGSPTPYSYDRQFAFFNATSLFLETL